MPNVLVKTPQVVTGALALDFRSFVLQSILDVEYSKAVSQISVIHEQLAKGEIYRGYRPIPVALSGLCGLAGASVQPYVVPEGDVRRWILYWTSVAALSGAVAASEIVFNYLFRESEYGRRRTRRVVGQFGPALVAGAAMTAAAIFADGSLSRHLSGLWALIFGLGVFASRPYLPRAAGWVALYYFSMGIVWLVLAPGSLSGWLVGGTFAVGQIGTAIILYWNMERTSDAEEG